ncbi:hypothetical protein [uncultured Alistipes sp.]|uniref:hypothetical protein n=1 Tax=uncultured Alistipes sp. TaxID=538949 RepID=UPI0025989DE4|nr:hypothetical protein [uncultured Alistipes sp.]
MRSRQTNKPDKYIVSECVKVLRDELPYNLHIFVNSVEFIAKVIDTLELAPEAVKIVCSTSGESRRENQRKLGNAYPIGRPSDPAKKINFYTSTAFEGCDIYDENGVTFIVSDGRKAHTLLDISTLFTQICGRIRNSRYKAQIVHVYSTTKYSKAVTLDEFIKATRRTLADAEKFASDINAVDEPSREKLLKKIPYINEQYVRIADNRLIVEKNLANMDIVNFKISRHIYATYVNLTDELQRNGYEVTVRTYNKVVERLTANPTARTTFRELFDEYCRLKTTTEQFFVVESPAELCTVIERRHPLVKQAYDELGTTEVRALKYHVGNIRRELAKRLSASDDHKIVKMINATLTKQTPIPKNEAKERLQEIYDTLGLKRKAKATDLAEWYEIKDAPTRIKGKPTACVAIIRDKMIVK